MVGDRHGALAVGRRGLHETLHGRQAIEVGVLRVGVEVDEPSAAHQGPFPQDVPMPRVKWALQRSRGTRAIAEHRASRIAPVRTKGRRYGSVVAGHTVVFGLSRTRPVHVGVVNTQVRARSRTSRTFGEGSGRGRGARVWPTIHIRTPSRVYGCGCTG